MSSTRTGHDARVYLSALTAAVTDTVVLRYLSAKWAYAVNNTLEADQLRFFPDTSIASQIMTAFLDGFIDSHQPDKIALIGAKGSHVVFRAAVENENVLFYRVVIEGVAKLVKQTKQSLKIQPDNCTRDRECDELQ